MVKIYDEDKRMPVNFNLIEAFNLSSLNSLNYVIVLKIEIVVVHVYYLILRIRTVESPYFLSYNFCNW